MTPPLDPDRWARAETLFAEALERPEAERSAFLERACGDDETPNVQTGVGPARPGVQLPGMLPAPQGAHGAAGAPGDELSQTISLHNIGNVHLANVGLDYALRMVATGEQIATGEITGGDFLPMLEPFDVEVPLDVSRGHEYRLDLTARAETPVGTLSAFTNEWTIGVYEMEIGALDSDDGQLDVTVHSSPELDVRRLDPGSMSLAGWRSTTGAGSRRTGRRRCRCASRSRRCERSRATSRRASRTSSRTTPCRPCSARRGRCPPPRRISWTARGTPTGALDVGDIRAYLAATGALPGAGGTAATNPPSLTPVMLLLTGSMDGDQRAYGMDILLLNEEG